MPLDAAKIRALAGEGKEPFASFVLSSWEENVIFAFEKLSLDQCIGLILGLFGVDEGWVIKSSPDKWAFVHCLTGIYKIKDSAKRAAVLRELIVHLNAEDDMIRYFNIQKYSDESNAQREAAFEAFPKDYVHLALDISDDNIGEGLLTTIAKVDHFLLDRIVDDMDLHALSDAARLHFLTWAKTVRPRFDEIIEAQNLDYPPDPVIDTAHLLVELDKLSVSDDFAIARLFEDTMTEREYVKLLEDFEKTKPITIERFNKFLVAISDIHVTGYKTVTEKMTPLLERLKFLDLQDFFSRPMMANVLRLATAGGDATKMKQTDLTREYCEVCNFLGDYLNYAFEKADELYGKELFTYFCRSQPKLCEAKMKHAFGKNLERMGTDAKKRCEAWVPAFLKRAEYQELLNRLNTLDVDRQTRNVETHFDNISDDQFEKLLGEFLNLPSKPYDLFKKFLLATYYIKGTDKERRYAALIKGLNEGTLREYFSNMNSPGLLKFDPDNDDCYKSPDWVVHQFLGAYLRFAFAQARSNTIYLLNLFKDKQPALFLCCIQLHSLVDKFQSLISQSASATTATPTTAADPQTTTRPLSDIAMVIDSAQQPWPFYPDQSLQDFQNDFKKHVVDSSAAEIEREQLKAKSPIL